MSRFLNSPLLLGFDHFERALDRLSKTSSEGYPPYNIEQIGENGIRITLAVAGFSQDHLYYLIQHIVSNSLLHLIQKNLGKHLNFK
jgi:hypothetical protein